MALVRSNDNDYHLRIISYRGNPGTRQFGNRLDDFLDDLYNVDVQDPTVHASAPLQFSECRVSEHAGQPAVMIKFELSPNGVINLTLKDALAELCQKIFVPSSFPVIQHISKRSILGLSAISGTFRMLWNQSLFRQMLSEGKPLLQKIEEVFDDKYLPDWALASIFSSFTGFLGILTEKDPDWNLAQITQADCNIIATSILMKLADKTELANPELQQRNWAISHGEFKQDIGIVMGTITALTVQVGASHSDATRVNEVQYANLCEQLYDATVAAAKTHTANRELLYAYVELHKKAHASMIINGVAAGTYLASVTAFSVSTTTPALLLSQWTLVDTAGCLLLGELPIIQTATLWFCPPLAALSLGGAAWFGWSSYKDKKKRDMFAKKVHYHHKLTAFIVQAWKIAQITRILLLLVHCTNTADVEFVDDQSRAAWSMFITRVNDVQQRRTLSQQLSPRHVLIFLNEQKRDFEAWRRDLEVHEGQILV